MVIDWDHYPDWVSHVIRAANAAQKSESLIINERMRELERQRDEAREECERLREDAERYRWLRSNASTEDLFGIEFWLCDTGEEIDAAIDAAMRGGK